MIGAVDIGGTKVAVGIVDDSGRALCKRYAATGSDCHYLEALPRVEAMLREVEKEAAIKITGIGIGSTGPVDPLSGAYGDIDLLPLWHGANLVEDLAQRFHVPVAIENDADAGALAEANWGAGQGRKRLVYVTLGTGIGGGIIIDGRLYRGVDGAHPEICHQVINDTGPPCSCGLRGCWEALARGPAMAAWFLRELPPTSAEQRDVTAEEICRLAREGHELALRAVKREAYYLGLGLANLINLFVPDAVVLGGGLMKSSDLLLESALKVIRQGCRFVPVERTEIVLASLGDDVNLIGAARVWYHRFMPPSLSGSSC